MPLTRPQLRELVAAYEDAHYSLLVFSPPLGAVWRTRWAAVVAKREAGLLLGLPVDDDLRNFLDGAPEAQFGFKAEVMVLARGSHDLQVESEAHLDVLLLDLPAVSFDLLKARPARGADPLGFNADGLLPHGPGLCTAAELWIAGLDVADDFYSVDGGAVANDPRSAGRPLAGEGGDRSAAPPSGAAGSATPVLALGSGAVGQGAAQNLEVLTDVLLRLSTQVGSVEQRLGALETRSAPAPAAIAAPASGLALPPPQLSGQVRLAPPALGQGGLGSLVGPAPARLPDPVMGALRLPPDCTVLDEEEGDEADAAEEDLATVNPRDRAFLRALAAQTAALTRLVGSADRDDLDAGGSGSSTGARGAAAMERQRQRFLAQPGQAVLATRALLAKASGTDAAQRQDARAFYERHGTFQTSRKDIGYLAFLLAEIWNALELNQVETAHALVGRGLATADQMSRGGPSNIAFLWTHLAEPPWGVVDRAPRAELQPFSQLAPPALVAASVAYVRDMDVLTEKMVPPKRGPPPPRQQEEPAAKAPRRRGGKGDGKAPEG